MQIKSLRTERVSVNKAVAEFKEHMKEGVRYNSWHLACGSLREVSETYPCQQVWIENGSAYYDRGIDGTYGSARTEKRKLAEVN